MDLDERLRQFDDLGDWQQLVESLEEALESVSEPTERAELHLKVGEGLYARRIGSSEALNHFHCAYKLDEAQVGALSGARRLYAELGNRQMARRLLEAELKVVGDQPGSASSWIELGDSLAEEERTGLAEKAYRRALEVGAAVQSDVAARLGDLAVGSDDWEEYYTDLSEDLAQISDDGARAEVLLRASRVASRLGRSEGDALLSAAYVADPLCEVAVALYEAPRVERGESDSVVAEQEHWLSEQRDGALVANVAFGFGARWLARYNRTDLALHFVEWALRAEPKHKRAFGVFRHLRGEQLGQWEEVVAFAEGLAESTSGKDATFLWSAAAGVAMNQLGDPVRARRYYDRVAEGASAQSAPHSAMDFAGSEPAQENGAPMTAERPDVTESDAQEDVTTSSSPPGAEEVGGSSVDEAFGEEGGATLPPDALSSLPPGPDSSLPPGVLSSLPPGPDSDLPPVGSDGVTDDEPSAALMQDLGSEPRSEAGGARASSRAAGPSGAPDSTSTSSAPAASYSPPASVSSLGASDLPPPSAASRPAPERRSSLPAPGSARYSSSPPLSLKSKRPPSIRVEASDAEIEELRDKLSSQESQNRAHEVVKTLVALGDRLPEASQRIEYYSRAAELYSNKFMNQAEAVRTHEKILGVDPGHSSSVQFLLQMYEKRRDWEKLVRLRYSEAEAIQDDVARGEGLKELAELATTRIKKPSICIELWQSVLEVQPSEPDALAALAKLYERSRDFEQLATVLERLAEGAEGAERVQLLTKLGQIVGDRLKDDERAIGVYRELVALEPANRRAQEQLKKRYVALGRWDDLDEFYASSGRWDEFIRVLESNEARAETTDQRVRMLMKIADLWESKRERPERAARAYEKIISIDAVNREAAQRLAPIYRAANNAKGLVGVLEVELNHVGDPQERLELLRQLTSLYESRLKDLETAYERSRQALELAPTDVEVQRDADRLAEMQGLWEPLVASYRSAVEKLQAQGEHEAQSALRIKLGNLYSERLGNVEDALEQFRHVAEVEIDNVEALRALQGLYSKTERYEELLEVYRRLAALADSPGESAEIAREIAKVHETHLEDLPAAIDGYEAVLAHDPFDSEALLALDRLLPLVGQWDKQAEVLERRLELDLGDEELSEVKYRLGKTQQLHLDNSEAAVATFREVLSLSPSHEGAREALESFLEGDHQTTAAEVLVGVYEVLSDWDRLIGVLTILSSSTEEAVRRAEVHCKIGEVAEVHLASPGRAFDAYADALHIDPSSESTIDHLERLAESAERWADLERLYHEVADRLGSDPEARAYRFRAARNAERRGDVQSAAGNYERILESDPADVEALAAIDALYRGAELWRELVGVFERRIALCVGDEEVIDLYGKLASVQADKLELFHDAITCHKSILSLDPSHERSLLAMDQLLSKTEQWRELGENLETRLKLADTEEKQRELMLRLAELCEQQLEDVDRAIDTYREILERDPYDEQALRALERLGTGEYELVVAEILEPLYQQLGEYDKLVEVYEVQARRAEDPSRKVELFHRIASLHEDVAGNVTAAFSTYARALEVDPVDETTANGLDRIARAAGTFEELAGVYESLAERQGDDIELAAQMFSAAARVVELDLLDTRRAVQLYYKVHEITPEDLECIAALQRLLGETGQLESLSTLLQHKSQVISDVAERKGALFEAAELEVGSLGRPTEAISIYRKVLEVDPDEEKALNALAGLYLETSNWELLLEVQLRKVDLAETTDDKKAIYYQMGAVYERELEDSSRAMDIYQRVLELEPDDMMALGRLDVLYQAAENWAELLTILGHEAELATDSAEAVSFQFRIAELYEKRLQDVERAIELYREIVGIEPEHAPTLQALEGLKAGSTEFALGAAQVLEPVYDALAEWESLVSALSVQAEHCDDAFGRIDLFHRIAQLREDRIGDSDGAFNWYGKAVAEDPGSEQSLGALERVAEATSRWAEVASLYESQLERLRDDPQRQIELGLRVAQVYEVQLTNVDAAVEHYRGVLALDVENPVAVRSLSRLFREVGRWEDLVEILKQEALIAATPDEILDCKYSLGRVYQDNLKQFAGAVAAYDDVLASAPEHAQARGALEELFEAGHLRGEIAGILEPLYEAGADWDQLVAVHEAQLADLQDPEERTDLYYRICEDYEERLQDNYRAFGVMARAFGERPKSERVQLDLERLATTFDGGWEELANTYADVMSVDGAEPEVLAQVGRYLARVFEEELADIEKAEEAYRYVLTVVPGEETALAQLDRIYAGTEQWAELAQVLEQRAAGEASADRQVELYSRLGRVYEEALEQFDSALRVFRLVFDDLAPADSDATAALVRIYERNENWEQLEGVYQRQLESALGDVEQADIRARLAMLASEHLNRAEEAVEEWKRVLDLRGEDSEALDALATLYERGEQWAELGDVLERLYDVALEDEERIVALTRRARLFTDALKRHDEAIEAWNRVLDIDFSNVDALTAIAGLRRGKGEHIELADALHQTVDRAAERMAPEQLREVHRELAKLYEVELEQPEEASDAWRQLLAVDASDFEAMERLEAIYRASESWSDVVSVQVQRAAALATPDEKIAQLLEAALIWKDIVREYDQAVEVFDRVLEVDPSHSFAFEELEKLHTLAERWEPLVEVYLSRLEATEEPTGRADILRRIARVFERHLEDPGQAFDALLSAFAEDYSDDETVSYIERLAQVTERWPELIASTNEWLQEQTEDREKIQLCLRLGKWYGENLGRPEYAQPYYAQITQLDPNNAQVLRQMAHIYRQSAQWKKMGDSLYKALEVAVANEDRKTILVDLGDLLDKHMSRQEEGVTYYRRALDVDPYHLPALDALERIYSSTENFAELGEVLERKVKGLRELQEIADVQIRLGGLYEQQLGAWDKAASVYRAVVDYDAGSIAALMGLQRVYEHTKNWGELVSVLQRQLDVVDTERSRLDALLKLAQVQEEQFLKSDLAAERLEQALEINPAELEAYSALERCYRRLKRWPEFVATCERHVAEISDIGKKIELFEQVALVFADELDDGDRAIDAYENIVALQSNHLSSISALARLYDKQGDSAKSIEAMVQVADLTTDGAQRVDMYYRIGRALEEKMLDRGQAKDRFELALDIDPTHLASIAALRHIAQDEGDWDSVARYLEQEQRNTESTRARAKLLVELGQVHSERLDDRPAGVAAFEQAVAADSECEEAALPLVHEYVSNERWADAVPLAEMLVRRGKGREPSELGEMYRVLGMVYRQLAKYEKAREAYQLAHELNVSDSVAVEGLAAVSFELQDWPSALTNYQKVLSTLGDSEPDQLVEVYCRLGLIKKAQGQSNQAINNFEKALAIAPDDRGALLALSEVHQLAENWPLVAELKRRILEQTVDDVERVAILTEIAGIWGEKQKDTVRAIEALEEARDLQPQDHALLHGLLQYYQAAGDWGMMVDTLAAISELEPEASRKARYSYTMAQLYRDKIQDLDRAVELFNEALDFDSSILEAFERINKILTLEKNWKQLERQYRKMLHRIAGKGNTDLEFTLWHQLGLVYRDRLSSVQPALEAFKMASSLRPDESQERVILSELHEVAGQFDEAIAEQRILLDKQPLSVSPYRALFRLYGAKGAVDAAWCSAGALVFMQQATPEEREFYLKYKTGGMPQVTGRVTNDSWARYIIHRDQNVYISKLFEMLTPAALQAKIAMLRAKRQLPELDKRLLQDPKNSTVTFAKTFFWAANILAVHAPELYVRSDIPGSVVAVPMLPPASLAGQTVLTGFTPQELTFICGKHLSAYRGEHYIRTLFPTQAELTILLFAGILLASPNAPMPPEMAQQIRMTAQELAKFIQPVQHEGLRTVVKHFIEEGAKANIKLWNQAVEMSAARAGLILCGDLEICKKVLSSEQPRPGEPSAADKMKSLLAYSVSEDYFHVRQQLGVAN